MEKKWMWMPLALLAAVGLAACLASCSQGDAVKAANTIHAYLPVVTGLANDAVAIAGVMDPAEASTLQALSVKVQAELQELERVSGAYAAAPTADVWTRIGTVVDALVSDADQGLLAALAIKNPESQVKARIALSALDSAMHVLDGYLMAARTSQETQAAASRRASAGAVKLQTVVRYWSPEDRQRVEVAFGARFEDLSNAEMKLGF